MSPQLNPQLIEHDQEMEHPPPLPTTSLEDLPPPYLDYLDAAALCRLGYGTTKQQHFGVTSAAVRCATDRDAVPLNATAPPGARDALELLRRRERAVCWEPFGARSQFLQRRWRRGPTTPDDAYDTPRFDRGMKNFQRQDAQRPPTKTTTPHTLAAFGIIFGDRPPETPDHAFDTPRFDR